MKGRSEIMREWVSERAPVRTPSERTWLPFIFWLCETGKEPFWFNAAYWWVCKFVHYPVCPTTATPTPSFFSSLSVKACGDEIMWAFTGSGLTARKERLCFPTNTQTSLPFSLHYEPTPDRENQPYCCHCECSASWIVDAFLWYIEISLFIYFSFKYILLSFLYNLCLKKSPTKLKWLTGILEYF